MDIAQTGSGVIPWKGRGCFSWRRGGIAFPIPGNCTKSIFSGAVKSARARPLGKRWEKREGTRSSQSIPNPTNSRDRDTTGKKIAGPSPAFLDGNCCSGSHRSRAYQGASRCGAGDVADSQQLFQQLQLGAGSLVWDTMEVSPCLQGSWSFFASLSQKKKKNQIFGKRGALTSGLHGCSLRFLPPRIWGVLCRDQIFSEVRTLPSGPRGFSLVFPPRIRDLCAHREGSAGTFAPLGFRPHRDSGAAEPARPGPGLSGGFGPRPSPSPLLCPSLLRAGHRRELISRDKGLISTCWMA